MARELPISVHVEFDGPLFGGDLDDDEGEHVLTVPTKVISTKNNHRKRRKEEANANDENDENESEDDQKLKQFINKYKLNKLSKILLNEGITIEFLISQTDEQIDDISKELNQNIIQQNKFKYAVKELKLEHAHDNDEDHFELKMDELVAGDRHDESHELDVDPDTMHLYRMNQRKKIPISKKTETIKPKFGHSKTITTWYFNDIGNIKHEIILKHTLKMDKHLKSKRVIIVDGKERYSKKSCDTNFIINNCGSDHVRVSITFNDDKSEIFYDLFINEMAFDDLLHQKSEPSFSL